MCICVCPASRCDCVRGSSVAYDFRFVPEQPGFDPHPSPLASRGLCISITHLAPAICVTALGASQATWLRALGRGCARRSPWPPSSGRPRAQRAQSQPWPTPGRMIELEAISRPGVLAAALILRRRLCSRQLLAPLPPTWRRPTRPDFKYFRFLRHHGPQKTFWSSN